MLMEYKGYHSTIKYDAEEDAFRGSVLGIRDFISFEAKSVIELKKEFRFSVNDYIASYEETGEQPNTPFAEDVAPSLELEYKDYEATIEYDAEVAVFYGEVIGIMDVIYFESDSVEGLEKEFHVAIEDYLTTCAQKGKKPDEPFSGIITLYTTPRIHKAAAIAACKRDKSLNTWIENMVAEAARVAIRSTKD